MGCENTKTSQMPQEGIFNQVQFEQTVTPVMENDISLVSLTNTLRLGESGSMTIQGIAGETYTVTAFYKITDKIINTTQSKIAGSDGRATWTWVVDRKTVPGTYPLTVIGGNRKFSTVYTVVE